MSAVSIKRVNRSELPFFAELIRESFATLARDFKLDESKAPHNAAFLKLSDLEADFDSGAEMYSLSENKAPAGFVQLKPLEDGTLLLNRLAVLPEYRGRGFARKLLAFADLRALELRASRIELTIIDESAKHKRLYSSEGYIQTDTRAFPDRPYKVAFMEKRFSPERA
ncbi:MAG: GNAT family N-acetyltransferase [Oscillospiraceae bacterium]|nr:GNAT family N-acetyltransferase [Oscillospiraceae bacterium]